MFDWRHDAGWLYAGLDDRFDAGRERAGELHHKAAVLNGDTRVTAILLQGYPYAVGRRVLKMHDDRMCARIIQIPNPVFYSVMQVAICSKTLHRWAVGPIRLRFQGRS